MLLERSRFDEPRVGETLAPDVQPLLADLGLWPQFLNLHPLPSYGTRSLWGDANAAEQSHLLTPYLCGWHVDRLEFDRMLACSAAQAGARLRFGARVLRCMQNADGGVTLHVGDVGSTSYDEIRADFVIDASGRGGTVGRSFNARYAIFDRLVGVAAQFDDALAKTHCYTLVEATADGWWYSAPLTPDRSVAMFMTDGDLPIARNIRALPRWRAAVQRTTLMGERVGAGRLRCGPRIINAVSQRLVRASHDHARWLAVGDAALSVDPISGSGVLNALRMAEAAASTVVAVLSGVGEAIASYEAERDNECTEYLIKRAAYYGMEERWPDTPFWQRRLAAWERHLSVAPPHTPS